MRKAISVKQLGLYLRHQLLSDPYTQDIYITGEIVDLHIKNYTYFSLKEDDEIVSCIYYDKDFEFSEGDKVILEASLNLYQKASKYQLKVKNTKLIGIGNNFILLKKLKEKLLSKGYFSEIFKKEIPKFPKRIGLITGTNSAAYFDFLKVLNDNNYDVDIYLYTSLVQGNKADIEISNALQILDELNLDLIVMTRGGGSKEDLSVFNSELIADKIFDLKTPIISAIGHEIDLSIAELTSDIYVSTPTKAAEIIVKNYNEIKKEIVNIQTFLDMLLNSKVKSMISVIDTNKFKIESNSPKNLLNKYKQDIKLNFNVINSSIDKVFNMKNNIVNYYYKMINKKYSDILSKYSFYIKSLSNKSVDINNLTINESYIIYNNEISYKVLIQEKNDGINI